MRRLAFIALCAFAGLFLSAAAAAGFGLWAIFRRRRGPIGRAGGFALLALAPLAALAGPFAGAFVALRATRA